MSFQSRTFIKRFIDNYIVNTRIIYGKTLNQLFTDLLDTLKPDFIVASTAARNALADKYAGMLVYVRNDSLYVLEDDLTTWSEFVKNGYDESEVDNLLSLKVDKVGGKTLTDQNFTLTLLNKLNAIDDAATKVSSTSDVPGLIDELLISIKNARIITADHTATNEDHTILIDASGGDIYLGLQSAGQADMIERIYHIKRIDESVNSVRILPYLYDESDSNVGDDIEFAAHLVLNDRNAIRIQSINGSWYKV